MESPDMRDAYSYDDQPDLEPSWVVNVLFTLACFAFVTGVVFGAKAVLEGLMEVFAG